ncbi:MAG TPA: cytochrome c biogenesis protein CcsA [Bacteroidia bacterium]|jgi:cytochrome c-type biogenesis protein CcmF
MIKYPGEHYWPGYLGNVFVILAFVCALAAALCYFLSTRSRDEAENWRKLGRQFFYVHSLSIAGIICTLFWMIWHHMYEYYYVWEHSSNSMPMKYIFACFWEGQEGSFLLWAFWHVVLGNILIRKSKDWEAPVMTTFALVQTFLASMLLGIYISGYHFGSNPFTVLTREFPQFANMPFVKTVVIENGEKVNHYLEHLDGRGLNPLLQNYWMTIHPPTLFLGFASTLVPFAFAIAGLWTRRYKEWQKPALPWAFFGVMILGTGILMGGAWAYEALSFGGFWAWDPVENSSLVPWLTFVGGAHVMLINRNKGSSLFFTFFLIILTFILVLYSTFLTRSGILGSTSVHSFTDLGLMQPLLIYLLFFIGLALVVFVNEKKWNLIYTGIAATCFLAGTLFGFYKEGLALFLLASVGMGYLGARNFPGEKEETESMWSREFWMFIGALILLLSCFQVTFVTSFPVINKLFGTSFAIGAEGAIKAYNRWQVPFALIIMLLIAVSQYFKYKKTDPKEFYRRMSFTFFVSLALSLTASYLFNWFQFSVKLEYAFLLFACLFAILSNLSYWLDILKGKLDHAGASIAHAGFGLLLLGALLSTSRSQVISQNYKNDVSFLGKDYSNEENILLLRNDTMRMGNYYVTYLGKDKEGIRIRYKVEYMKKDSLTGKFDSLFTLTPFIQLNDRMGNAAEPDTRHFLFKDVYTHITFPGTAPEEMDFSGDYGEPHNSKVKPGDTIFTNNSIMVYEGMQPLTDTSGLRGRKDSVAVGAKLKIFDFYGKIRNVMPVYTLVGNSPKVSETVVDELGLKIAFWNVLPDENRIEISFSEKKMNRNDFIVMKAVVFPFINVLWTGCIIMIIGTVLAIRHRLKRA